MTLHLYALTDGPVDLAGGRGIDDVPLASVERAGLRAIVTEHATTPTVQRSSAVRHAAVVEVLARSHRTLPVRFGVHHDHDGLVAALEGSGERLRRLLDEVAGRREYAVRAASTAEPPPAPSPAARSGRAYLHQRLEDLRTADARQTRQYRDLDGATSELAELAERDRYRRGSAGLERCFLVAAEAVPAFERAAQRLREPASDLLVTGPWPPYSFTDGEVP